jgi:phosphoribosylformimino-5-aminoimidazole carboxamide ribotide isomerase
VGRDRVAFSLDLRNGQPIVMKTADISAGQNVETMTLNAVVAGVGTLIVIDLARVGTSTGVDATTLGRVRASAPDLRLIAGGGVRGWDDLVGLAKAGCNGALVATAVHNGSIGADEITAARDL